MRGFGAPGLTALGLPRLVTEQNMTARVSVARDVTSRPCTSLHGFEGKCLVIGRFRCSYRHDRILSFRHRALSKEARRCTHKCHRKRGTQRSNKNHSRSPEIHIGSMDGERDRHSSSFSSRLASESCGSVTPFLFLAGLC